MNKQILENTLLTIIDKAEKLKKQAVNTGVQESTLLEVIPNTSIMVEKDHTVEFTNLAAIYYGLIEHDLTEEEYAKKEFVTEVYNKLHQTPSKKASKPKKNPKELNIDQLISQNKRKNKKLEAYQKSYKTVDFRYQSLINHRERLFERGLFYDAAWQIKIDEVTNEITEYKKYLQSIANDITTLSSEINQDFATFINQEMVKIEEKKPADTKMPNGKLVPSTYQNAYLSLIYLQKLCTENIDHNTILFNNLICIKPDAEKLVKEAFLYINDLSKIEIQNGNNIFISEIKKELRRLVRRRQKKAAASTTIQNGDKTYRVLVADEPEFLTLLAIIDIIEKEINPNEELVKFGESYINSSAVELLTNLMQKTKFFEGRIPKPESLDEEETSVLKKTENIDANQNSKSLSKTNSTLISDLENKIDNLALGIKDYEGVTNLPIYITNALKDPTSKYNEKRWTVPKGCVEPCNYLIEAIEILSRAGNTKNYNLCGIDFANEQDANRFRDLVSLTDGFKGIFPKQAANEKKKEELLRQMAGLLAAAKEAKKQDPNCALAEGLNVQILNRDLPIYNRIKEQYICLENARFSTNLSKVNGVFIDKNEEEKYQKLDQKTEMTISKQVVPKINIAKINEYAELCRILAELAKNAPESEVTNIGGYRILKSDQKLFNLLGICGIILIDASESDDLVPVGDNVWVDRNSEKTYQEAEKILLLSKNNKRLREIKDIRRKRLLAKNDSLTITQNNQNNVLTQKQALPPSTLELPKSNKVEQKVLQEPTVRGYLNPHQEAPTPTNILKKVQPEIKIVKEQDPVPQAKKTPSSLKEQAIPHEEPRIVKNPNYERINALKEELNVIQKSLETAEINQSYYEKTSKYLLLKEQIKILSHASANAQEYEGLMINDNELESYKLIEKSLKEEIKPRSKPKKVQKRKIQKPEANKWWNENLSAFVENISTKVISLAYNLTDYLDSELYIASPTYQDYSEATSEEKETKYKKYRLGKIMTKVRAALERAQQNVQTKEKINISESNIPISDMPPEESAKPTPTVQKPVSKSTPNVEEKFSSLLNANIFDSNPVTVSRQETKEHLLAEKKDLKDKLLEITNENERNETLKELQKVEFKIEQIREREIDAIMEEFGAPVRKA